MSFNNHLAFNISKASATTSTTNTTTTSVSGNVKPITTSASREVLSATLSDLKLFLSHNPAPSGQGDGSPGIKPVTPTTSISGINSLTATTLEPQESTKDGLEILQIWGKYDLNNPGTPDQDSPVAVDSLEEKMNQFQINATKDNSELVSPKLSSLDFDEKKPHGPKLDEVGTRLQREIESTLNTPSTPVDLLDIFGVTSEPLLPVEGSVPQPSLTDIISEDMSLSVLSPKDMAPGSNEPENKHSLPLDMGIQPYVLPDESEPVESGHLAEMDSVTEYCPSASATAFTTKPSTKRHNSVSRIAPAVNPEEQHQQSHKPFDFQVFLAHLKNKSADPLVRYIQSFLVSFSRQSGALSASQMIKAVRNFKEFMNAKFLEYEPFASMDAVDLENSGEGVEKLIMNRLYDYCFSPEAIKKFGKNASSSVFDDVSEDYKFTLQLEKFSWILAIHLDIDLETFSQRKLDTRSPVDYIDHAVSELNKINKYRAPRDKIICILNACKIIFNLLENSKQEANADAFIPVLIIVIVRAKTDSLISNIQYIERYRGDEWLNHGETSYYLSSMQAAISFLQNIGMDDLTIDKSEYEANMEAWEAELRQRGPPISEPKPLRPANRVAIDQESFSPSNVILTGAEMFTKSLSNFISPSPLVQSVNALEAPAQPQVSETQIDETANQLAEIFPSLDRAVLRDVVIMKKADFEASLDICLQLCNDG